MPFGPLAESESRFDSKLSTSSEEKDTESGTVGCDWVSVGTESDGFGTQDLEANAEFRNSPFFCGVSCAAI